MFVYFDPTAASCIGLGDGEGMCLYVGWNCIRGGEGREGRGRKNKWSQVPFHHMDTSYVACMQSKPITAIHSSVWLPRAVMSCDL